MIKRISKDKLRNYIVLILSMLLIVSMTGCKKEEIVAKVDNINITKDELYNLLVEQYGPQALNSLIGEKIVELELKKHNIQVSEEEVQSELSDLIEYYGGTTTFNQAMMNQGVTMEDMKSGITMNLQINKLLEPTITITEEEIIEFFEDNKAYLAVEEQVSARHILVKSKEDAEEIIEMLIAGEDFGDLAKAFSTDLGSGAMGGDLGFFGRGEMVESFEEAAFSLRIGEVSDPVESIHGFHIIKVEDKKEAVEANLEEQRDKIRSAIIEEKISEAYHKWFELKYEEYKVINNLENPS